MSTNQDRPQSTPISLPESAGIETVSVAGPSDNANPSSIAGEVALDMTSGMFDDLFEEGAPPPEFASIQVEAVTGNNEEAGILRAHNEQLQAELACARSEMEFAQLKEEELEKRSRQSQGAIEGLECQVALVTEQSQQSSGKLLAMKAQLDRAENDKLRLQEQVVMQERLAAQAKDELQESQRQRFTAAMSAQILQPTLPTPSNLAPSSEQQGQGERIVALEAEGRRLSQELQVSREQASHLEVELAEAKLDAMAQAQASHAAQKMQALHVANSLEEVPMQSMSTQPTLELAENDERPLLQAAYQQISVLNTQMAHLYTELTLARTDLHRAKAGGPTDSSAVGENGGPPGAESATQRVAELEKQSAQIADLVSDIRHLQLDLEYHQQKLDQMIEEKQGMMKEMKKLAADLLNSKQQVEERDQILRHREVDLQHAKQEAKRTTQKEAVEEDSTLAALRSEASAKDSALIVSHYELHKEKLLRDRLEQKNLKLMDRMQKLMMVVETMRKENVVLERNLNRRERVVEDKDRQLRKVNEKARELSKHVKASGKVAPPTPRSGSMSRSRQPDLGGWEESDKPGLPPLTQRSLASAGGTRSGASTPRGGNNAPHSVPPSPYGGAKGLI